MNRLRTATFTVHATALQSARWKQASEAEAFANTGQWLAAAADAYLRARARAGAPVPLAWRRGRFIVRLEGGEELVRGHVSPPFCSYRGNDSTPAHLKRHTLVYLPERRILATLQTRQEVRALAADLARRWLREEPQPPLVLP